MAGDNSSETGLGVRAELADWRRFMDAASQNRKGIVIICNLDTRGKDIIFVKELILSRGHEAILVDFSMEEPPPLPGDVTCEQVALRGGLPIETVREFYR